ncbi:MAG TPA: hypothetical protein VEF89_05685 [Solirubrobacteraceae bacterium]|nr:hypothetical protein [Solirubrobacteraceae bacterium]
MPTQALILRLGSHPLGVRSRGTVVKTSDASEQRLHAFASSGSIGHLGGGNVDFSKAYARATGALRCARHAVNRVVSALYPEL